MAMAPPRPCTTCGKFQCTKHQADAWRTLDRPEVTRIRGRELQRRRAQLFASHPWCARCLDEGRRTRATIRDHIVPLAEGGTEDETNIQGLCLDCSDLKTVGESTRGVQRSVMTPRFRRSSLPRDGAGQFRTRRRS
jgi:5-methylcytosine-specific restriction enzyme A